MKAGKDIYQGLAKALSARDLVDHEQVISREIAAFVSFTSYSIYFPSSLPRGAGDGEGDQVVVYLPKEKRLLLPLILEGEILGYFLAKGVRLKAPKTLPAYLQALATKALEKLALYKLSLTDPLTGLANRDHLQAALAEEIERIAGSLSPETAPAVDASMPGFSGRLGLVLADLDRFQWVNENYGYAMGDQVLSRIGEAVAEACPEQAMAARVGDDAFALMVPDAAPGALKQLAEAVREAVSSLAFACDVSGDRIRTTASVGYASYPKDLPVSRLSRSPDEQARMLRRKAAKAVAVAKDLGRDRILAYSDIKVKGGRVLEVLPLGRVLVSLGRTVDAQEGRRFLVRSPASHAPAGARLTEDERLSGRYPTMYKGEIVLSQVQEDISFAETLHLSDPAWRIEPGDRLTLIREKETFMQAEASADAQSCPRLDPETGLYEYRDFLSLWADARQEYEAFSLLLAKAPESRGESEAHFQEQMDNQVADAAREFKGLVGEKALGGRYGLSGLIFFVPGPDHEGLFAKARDLVGESPSVAAAGVARYPYLGFHRSDQLENARKALDHAMLLPEEPRAALFDSLSLNVSADKLFTSGDLYQAVEEYKLALLADEANNLARVSLGVCYAKLGRMDSAKSLFMSACELEPDNAMALYNLGQARQRLGEAAEAEAAYSRCLKLDPGHAFALVRLGSMAEAAGKPNKALKLYEKLMRLPDGEALARPHLARLALDAGDLDTARDHLQEALAANHKDAYCLHLLARIYLEGGQDPQIAETLARQSAALKPERQEFWEVLAKALAAQGKHDQARAASLRAM